MSSTTSTYTPTAATNPNSESSVPTLLSQPADDNISSDSFFDQCVSFSPLFIALVVLTIILALTVVGIQIYRERNRRRLAKKCTQETVNEYVHHAFENTPVTEALPSYSSAGSQPAVPEVVVQSISRQAYENIINIPDYGPNTSNNLSVTSRLPPAYEQLQEGSAVQAPHSIYVSSAHHRSAPAQIPTNRTGQQMKSV